MPISNHFPKPQPINGQSSGLKHRKRLFQLKSVSWVNSLLIMIAIGAVASVVVWYNVQLSPTSNNSGRLIKITIASGSSSGQIAQELEKKSVIRSSAAFNIYIRLACQNKILKAGTYRLSPAESTPKIVEHLSKGSNDTFNITFYPGATLTDTTSTPKSKKYDVTTVLENAGYSDEEIKTALSATYDTKTDQLLFADRPSTTSLEGYVYGETYNFSIGATVQDVLQRSFDEFYKQISDNNLVAKLADHGLNLYQGITLASIVQREDSNSKYQPQIAQVFYTRLATNMVLGSDVTYQYIADKMGATRSPNLDSPYNLRINSGLTPGPIAVPGLSAVMAVANPASGDYLYFLSGDDDVVYFAHTEAEHESNITSHCKVKCSTS